MSSFRAWKILAIALVCMLFGSTSYGAMDVQPVGEYYAGVSYGTFNIVVSGNYAYIGVTNGGDGFVVVDVSDPSNPTRRGTVSGPVTPYLIDGNNVYTASHIVNVSNPDSPSIVAAQDSALIDTGHGMVKSGNYGFLAGMSGDLKVLDLTSPTLATLKTLNIPDADSSRFEDIVQHGDYLYLAMSNEAGPAVEVVNVSDPLNPVIVGSIESGAPSYVGQQAFSLAVDGDTLYQTSTWTTVSDLAASATAPTQEHAEYVATTQVDYMAARYGNVFLSGNQLQVYDTATSGDWTLVGTVTSPEEGGFFGIAVQGDYVYAVNSTGFVIYRVTDLGGRISEPTASTADLGGALMMLLEGEVVPQ